MKPNTYISDVVSPPRQRLAPSTTTHTYYACSSPENLRRSVENINAKLGGIKKMDLFECARVPENVSLEDLINTLSELKSERHFSHIGMSECSAATLRRAHAVNCVEIEVSLWSYEEETKKGAHRCSCHERGASR